MRVGAVPPIEIVDDMLDRYDAAQEELALVSANTKHDATRVGAIRTRLDALAAQANLLMLVGVLPRDFRQLRHEADVRELARETLDVFDAFDVPVEAKRELLVLNGNGHPQSPPDVNQDRPARGKRPGWWSAIACFVA